MASTVNDIFYGVDAVNVWGIQTFNWPVGSEHDLSAHDNIMGVGKSYQFVSWSDGGGLSHTFTVPDCDQTLLLTYNTKFDSEGTVTPVMVEVVDFTDVLV